MNPILFIYYNKTTRQSKVLSEEEAKKDHDYLLLTGCSIPQQ